MHNIEFSSVAGTPTRRTLISRALGLAAGALPLGLAGEAWAQQWPARAVRIVVNGPPGGVVDSVARLLSAQLADRLGAAIVVDNKAGGSGLIGVQEILRAAPDGSTFLASLDGVFTEVPHSVKVNFDPLKDAIPMADLFYNGWVLVAREGIPARSMADLVAWMKRQPEPTPYGSFSAGTISHILGEQLSKAAGVPMNHVPYRGGPDAMQGLLGGHVSLLFSGVAQALPHIKSGRITPLLFTGTERSTFLPAVPTAREAGYADMSATSWVGVWARKEVPQALQERFAQALASVLALPEVREKIAALGSNPAKPRGSAELVKQMAVDYPRARTVLQAAGITPQ